ncbi:hypothetical protein [Peribacillus frigoritolerans]|uniref:hypothetical protein n=1 Tax=Peribacillus frigoritolerans TaxID=450367 RepID=UPI00215AEE9D|nr:hypothetical protein [Peribacillus frigoritolerans]MCR8870688.1 hypothetical protein [Peribacillus frigoritolerans]
MVKVLQASNNRTEAESAIKKPNIVYYMRMHENLLNSSRLPYILFFWYYQAMVIQRKIESSLEEEANQAWSNLPEDQRLIKRVFFLEALFVKIVVFKTKLIKVDWSGSARLLREQRDR